MVSTRTSTRRIFAWTAGAIIVGILIVVAFRPRPIAVDVAAVERGTLQVTVDREGKTRVHDRYLVSAPVPGRVRRIELQPGDQVAAGRTVVATFVPSAPPLLDVRSRAEAQARVRAAEAGVAQARAALAQARVERQHADTQRARVEALFRDKVTSKAEVDAAQADARAREEAAQAAAAALTAAQQQLEVARAALVQASGGGATHELVIHSPIDGVVLRRLHESESVVPAGEPLVEIADTADLEIVADYLSTEAVKIRPDMPAIIDRWGGDHPLRGRVHRVEPFGFLKVSALGVEEQRVNVILGIEDPPDAWRSLGDGYRVEVRVVLWEQSNVLKVPTSALFRHGADWAVFVVENGRARLRPVRIGERTGVEAQVVDGLAEGNTVIVHPSDAVANGVRVTRRTS